MNSSYYRWKRLFLFALGLFIGTAFCMKWLEGDFWVKNEKFTILGLELFYSKEKVQAIVSSLDYRVQTILRYQLYFDFAFMAGVYPGIISLCMMAREKLSSTKLKKILFLLAAFQLLAWTADITENFYLLLWIKKPFIGNEFEWYHGIVAGKWIIALAGVLLSIPIVLRKKATRQIKTHFFI
ncbi:MAG: hypothetical protein ABI675_05365 [Chitinophagaceae bacterium]